MPSLSAPLQPQGLAAFRQFSQFPTNGVPGGGGDNFGPGNPPPQLVGGLSGNGGPQIHPPFQPPGGPGGPGQAPPPVLNGMRNGLTPEMLHQLLQGLPNFGMPGAGTSFSQPAAFNPFLAGSMMGGAGARGQGAGGNFLPPGGFNMAGPGSQPAKRNPFLPR